MAQKILALINLQLPAGQATPAPPVVQPCAPDEEFM